MRRREFLRYAAALSGGAATVGLSKLVGAGPVDAGGGSYGPLGPADSLGIQLPEGFSARIVATTGEKTGGSAYVWHRAPDGGATFATPDGGWIYVSNSEVGNRGGGVGAVEFDRDGNVVDAYSILSNTSRNCAGGPTPWGTWLSCEEVDVGRVWECDPTGLAPAVVRPALGTFSHEAVAVDPVDRRLYLTEDHPEGRFYRFTPAAYPDLGSGTLEAAALDGDGAVAWIAVGDPTAASAPTRAQAPGSTAFNGGEGAFWSGAEVVFTTKGDNNVWAYSPSRGKIRLVYDASGPLNGVDNVVVDRAGDIFVAEDGGNMELVRIGDNGVVEPFLRINNQAGSEVTGPAFSPDGSRLLVSSQRGVAGQGITYEIRGPFAGASAAPPATTSTSGPAPPASTAAPPGPQPSATSATPPPTTSSSTSVAQPAYGITTTSAPPRSSTSTLAEAAAGRAGQDDGGSSNTPALAGLALAVGAAGGVTYAVTRSRRAPAGVEAPPDPPPPPPSR